MENDRGLRGSYTTRVDEKGRLKLPTRFCPPILEVHGSQVYVTSLRGESVLIYPMPVWFGIEAQLKALKDAARQTFLDHTAYWGQELELDPQGRVVIPPKLRERASILGEVRVFGRIDYVEVWNEERYAAKLDREPVTDETTRVLSANGIPY